MFIGGEETHQSVGQSAGLRFGFQPTRLVSCTTISSLVSRNATSFPISQDNHEEATIGAFIILEISQALAETDDLDNDISDILTRIEAKCKRQILHTVCWY